MRKASSWSSTSWKAVSTVCRYCAAAWLRPARAWSTRAPVAPASKIICVADTPSAQTRLEALNSSPMVTAAEETEPVNPKLGK
jgi:hypothetical protein